MEQNTWKRERDILKKVYVSKEENQKIKRLMQKTGSRNFSAYARKCLTNQKLYTVDLTEIKELIHEVTTAQVELKRLGNNINQISKSINTTEQNITKELLANYEEQLTELNAEIRKTVAGIVKEN